MKTSPEALKADEKPFYTSRASGSQDAQGSEQAAAPEEPRASGAAESEPSVWALLEKKKYIHVHDKSKDFKDADDDDVTDQEDNDGKPALTQATDEEDNDGKPDEKHDKDKTDKVTFPIGLVNLGGRRKGDAPQQIFNDLLDHPSFATIILECEPELLAAMDESGLIVRSEVVHGITVFAKNLAEDVRLIESCVAGEGKNK